MKTTISEARKELTKQRGKLRAKRTRLIKARCGMCAAEVAEIDHRLYQLGRDIALARQTER